MFRQVLRVSTPVFRGITSRNFATVKYTKAHEYASIEGNIATIGITDFAQAALGDVVYVELPSIDSEYEKGESFGSVESVKAASDVYSPLSGKVIEINEALSSSPELINSSAESTAWFIKIELSDLKEGEELMDAAAYKILCEEEAH